MTAPDRRGGAIFVPAPLPPRSSKLVSSGANSPRRRPTSGPSHHRTRPAGRIGRRIGDRGLRVGAGAIGGAGRDRARDRAGTDRRACSLRWSSSPRRYPEAARPQPPAAATPVEAGAGARVEQVVQAGHGQDAPDGGRGAGERELDALVGGRRQPWTMAPRPVESRNVTSPRVTTMRSRRQRRRPPPAPPAARAPSRGRARPMRRPCTTPSIDEFRCVRAWKTWGRGRCTADRPAVHHPEG